MSDRLIDNQTLRLADALNQVAPYASQARFAVGYFFLSGFEAITDALAGMEHVQLLIGSVTNRRTIEELALGYRRRELVEEKLRQERFTDVGRAIDETAGAIRQHLSELQPGERPERTIITLADMIASGRLEVRIFTQGVLHAKAYIFDYKHQQPNSKGIGIVGSSNLTESGLAANSELNVQVDDNADVMTGEGMHRDLCEWFDKLWAAAKPFSEHLLTELQQSWAMAVARPYDVYLKMLFELVRNRLEDDASKLILPEDIPLASYQKVAVHQAIGMVRSYQGAFVADVVGVGKSFVGAAVARHFYESERRRTLVLCPNALEPMWKDYNRRWHLNAEIVPFGKLRQRSDGDGAPARSELDEDYAQDCGFVLIDESHNLRYAESQRYRVVSDYLLDGADRKVLLLTATPYNKSYFDVYNQIRLFQTEETTRIPVEPRNIREYFKRVQAGERKLQDLLVHLLVRRTRWQLLRWYGYDAETHRPVDPQNFPPYLAEERRAYLKFIDVAGVEDHKFFPHRDLETVTYCVDDVYGLEFGRFLYAEIVRMLHRKRGGSAQLRLQLEEDDDPALDQTDPRALTYARYGLYGYVLGDRRHDPRYRQLVRAGINLRGLIRTSLFKRLESSVEAFRVSIDRQIMVHRNFLAALDSGHIAAGREAARLLEGRRGDDGGPEAWDETEEALEQFIEQLEAADERRGFLYDIKDFDVDRLRQDVEHDLQTFQLIQGMVTRSKVPPERDAKLQVFLNTLLPTLLRRKKLLVFTQYEDTARYVYDHLPTTAKDHGALVTGATDNIQGVVNRFAPIANNHTLARGEHEVDVVIATDRLAEGLNLQDCSQVVNYDLHWNPVRLIQRFGRIDRVGSQHDRIFTYNFLPETAAEKELGLHQKLQARIKEFNDILGMDSRVLDETERINPEAVYAIYEEQSGKHLGRWEADEGGGLIGASLAEAEEFFRDLRERDPEEYQRIRNLRDGLRTARSTGEGKVLVLGRAGDYIRMYVRDMHDQTVDIDTTDALNLARCGPEESPARLPENLNRILAGVKLSLQNDVDELWKQRTTKSALTAGQRYALEHLEALRRERPAYDADSGISRLIEAASRTRQKRFQRACDALRRNKATGEPLLRRVRQLYYDCGLHFEREQAQEEEIELRIPRILAVMALT